MPLKVHFPDPKEASKNGWPADTLIIDEWLLLEYAVCSMPCNHEALTEAVSKAGELPQWLQTALGVEELFLKNVVPFQETPTAPEDRTWNAEAARKRLQEWAGGDQWDKKKYRQGFAYVEGDGSELADYKLPHHDILDGKLHVVWHGVTAAWAAVNGARGEMGLSVTDKEEIKKHLAGHYRQFGKEPPKQLELPPFPEAIPYTTWEEVERIITSKLSRIDFQAIAEKAVAQALDKACGRV